RRSELARERRRCGIQFSHSASACLYNLCPLVASGVTERNETVQRSFLLVQLSEGWKCTSAILEWARSIFISFKSMA
ncbi:hypothetical protein, partial [Pseudomonas nitroreducens]|uniref:hypothetical protein n=1 Tax=Pseudomonas nitroreducens TaxID=46680 RepID=UPI001F43F171